MATYTWDAIYDRLKVDRGGLPGKSTQDMLEEFWIAAGYPDGSLGADEKVAFYKAQGAIGDSLGDLENDYWYRVGPNLLAAKGAVFAIDAAQSVSGEQWALNRGSGGQVLRARYGSVGRAEIRNGVGLILPGVGGNFASIPDAAALDFSTTAEFIINLAADTYAAFGSSKVVFSKWNNAGGGLSYRLQQETGSTNWTFFLRDATTSYFYILTPGSIFTDGTAYWFRFVVDSTVSSVSMYWAPDSSSVPSSWTLVNTATAAPLTINNSASTLDIGHTDNGLLPFYGRVSRFIARSAAGGSDVLNVDFTAQTDLTTSFTCTTGQTVTVTAANAVDTNDPLFLPWNGENYVHFPGTAGNDASIPDSSVWCTTDSDVRVRAAADDWTSGSAFRAFVSQGWGDLTGYGLWFGLDQAGSGKLAFFFGSSGAGVVAGGASTVDPGLVDGQTYDVRATRVGSTGTIRFWMKDTSTSLSSNTGWTEIGTGIVAYAGFGIQNWSTGVLRIGSAPGNEHACKVYRARLHSSIDGTAVVDIDFTQNTNHSSFVCTTGQTVTFNRATSGRKLAVVTRPIWLLGTDDYMEVADNDLLDFGSADSLTAVVVFRRWGTTAGNARYLSKRSTVGYTITSSGGSTAIETNINDGTWKGPATQPLASGELGVIALVRDITGGHIIGYVNGAGFPSAPDASPGSLASATPLRIGCEGGSGALFADGEVLAAAVFRRALSDAEIAQLVTWYGAV